MRERWRLDVLNDVRFAEVDRGLGIYVTADARLA